MADAPSLTADDLTSRLGDMLLARELTVAAHPDCIGIGEDLMVKVIGVQAGADPRSSWRSFGVHVGIKCPSLFSETIFEFSYGGGRSDSEAADDALRRWVDYDLPALTEPMSGALEQCARVDMPGAAQAYLGPLSYRAGADAQPCCQHCLFTMSYDVLEPMMTATPVSCAIKIVAMKDADGTTSADVRRNGADVPAAMAAIAKAAEAWPAIPALQVRRQYIVLKAPAGGRA